MISDLVEAAVIERLVARTTANLAIELQRLHQNDETAREGANASGMTEQQALLAKAALEEWLRIEAPQERNRREPVKLPRTLIPSLLQSAYEEFFRAADMTAAEPAAQGLSPTDVPAADKVLDAEAREFLLGNRDYLGGRWFTRFAERDLRFLTWGAVAKIGTRLAGHRRPFTMLPPAPVTIDNRARIVLVGDWGSGVPRARQLGEVMRKSVQQAKDESRQVHVIHLGDVYYTGQSKEYDRRLLLHTCWLELTEEYSRPG